MKSHCPNAKWNVLAQDPYLLIMNGQLKIAMDRSDQKEIARLLKGNDGIHRIAYVRKVPKLEDAEREVWLKAFSEAYVENDGRLVRVAL